MRDLHQICFHKRGIFHAIPKLREKHPLLKLKENYFSLQQALLTILYYIPLSSYQNYLKHQCIFIHRQLLLMKSFIKSKDKKERKKSIRNTIPALSGPYQSSLKAEAKSYSSHLQPCLSGMETGFLRLSEVRWQQASLPLEEEHNIKMVPKCLIYGQGRKGWSSDICVQQGRNRALRDRVRKSHRPSPLTYRYRYFYHKIIKLKQAYTLSGVLFLYGNCRVRLLKK